MLVVDSQLHIWKNGLPTNPAHRQIAVYSQDDALREMEEAGVDAAVRDDVHRRTVVADGAG